MEHIIIKEITNQALDHSERSELKTWLKKSKENRMIYAQMKLALIYPESERREILKEEVWGVLEEKMSTGAIKKQSLLDRPWLKVAAAIVVFCSALLIAFQLTLGDHNGTPELVEVKMIEKVSLPGQKIKTQLPDGTIVKLNADSKILIPEFFTNDRREVRLIGEAFFDVVRDEKKPFIIKTGDIEIEVLGTSFNVSAYEDGTSKAVSVKTGKVSVKNKLGKSIELEPNEMTTVSTDGALKKQLIDNDDLVFGWMQQKIVFKDHSIDEVFNTLTKWYGIEIQIEKEIKSQKPYTATYKNPALTEVIESISHVYNFKYSINGKKIMIK